MLPEGFPYADKGCCKRSDLQRAYISTEFIAHDSSGFTKKRIDGLVPMIQPFATSVSSAEELSCFIENDLPIVSVNVILASTKFQDCVEVSRLCRTTGAPKIKVSLCFGGATPRNTIQSCALHSVLGKPISSTELAGLSLFKTAKLKPLSRSWAGRSGARHRFTTS